MDSNTLLHGKLLLQMAKYLSLTISYKVENGEVASQEELDELKSIVDELEKIILWESLSDSREVDDLEKYVEKLISDYPKGTK